MFLSATLIATYLHLLAVCVAIGVMLMEDITLLSNVAYNAHTAFLARRGHDRRRRTVFRLPGAIERNAVTSALLVLYVSGGWLVYLGLEARSDYMENPKLLAKLVLVILLTTNAIVLHEYLFPRMRAQPDVLLWLRHHMALLVLTVSLSAALWLYIAFLGVAREWSYEAVPFVSVLLGAGAVWAVAAVAIAGVLRLAGSGKG